MVRSAANRPGNVRELSGNFIEWSPCILKCHREVTFQFVVGSVQPCNPTVNFFADVSNRSPKLSRLHMTEVNLSNVLISDLPSSLESLAITESFLPYAWFQSLSASSTAVLPHLKELDLSNSSKTSDVDLGCIAQAWPELTVLKLNYCYRITAEGLHSVAEGLCKLEVLEVDGTDCDNVAVHHICRNLAATLCRLSVAECLLFTDGCAGTVASMLSCLRSLDVSRCPQLTDDGFLGLAHLKAHLQYLNVSSTAIGNNTLTKLKNSLPTCEIVYEA